TYHYIENCLRMIAKGLKSAGFTPFKNLIFIRKGGSFALYSTREEKEIFQKENHDNFLKDPKGLIKDFLEISEKFCRFAEEVHEKDLSNLSNEELLENLKEYYDLWVDFSVYVWVIWNLSETYAEYASKYISNKALKLGANENTPKYLESISSPIKKSSILLLDEEIKKGNLDIDRLFKDYAWMPWGDLHAKPWTKEDIVDYIQNHKPSESKVIDFSQLKEELKLTEEEIEMINLNKEVAYLRDYRDEVRRRTVYLIKSLYREIGKRFGIGYDDLMLYSSPELIEGKRLSAEGLEERKRDTVSLLENGKFIVYSGKEMDSFLKRIGFETEDYSQIKEIKGSVASQGKVKGPVKIIKLDKDIEKVEKGDVMVAITTHPDYTLKMQIASAIVTDEGGIMCHAAIVSRELGIPCIVGTETGTKILQDGDLVEVDAEKGVVRKI
ncbi:MAG: PEP-utilizing enzyme, partial [Nanoarchaeota archaeon]|nr:PEP-utilizing enzyme [Nanoarchaeota archaeon]